MKKHTKGLLLGSAAVGIVLSASLGASYKMAEKLVSVALDREGPKASGKSKIRITGADISYSILDLLNEKGKSLKEKNSEYIEIKASDGERLAGHLFTCQNAKRTIIAMHGWRSSWFRDFGMISEFWEKSGCNVLYAEQRGQNGSGGDCMGFGMMERHDCHDWVKWVGDNLEENLPIYLAGISMGASTVLMASGRQFDANVCGIMADCGFTSPEAIWRHIAENNLKISYGLMGKMADNICRRKINMSAGEYSTLSAMEKNTVPVLFIHGSDDKFVPAYMTYENYKVCKAPKSLLIAKGAGHAMSYITDKEAYENAVEDFFRRFDKSICFS